MKNPEEPFFSLEFFDGKKIFITGHTGFKGSWLCQMLKMANASVCGYALEPASRPNLFEKARISQEILSVIGDIRDLDYLKKCVEEFQPDIMVHMAAQPLVRESYNAPVYTYETNVMGTVHFLEAARQCRSVKSVLNVTTDKVYLNRETERGYVEHEPLDGFDPYSNSKSCSELVTHCYYHSFFQGQGVSVSTARSGNVIGGGDFAKDRIVPDCIRAIGSGEEIIVRNPHSIRPYQHVLEPLKVYLMILQKQYENPQYSGYYNVGPNEEDCITTGELVELFCRTWGVGASWKVQNDRGPHEANLLKLDCTKLKKTFRWEPRWNIKQALEKTIEWTKTYFVEEDVTAIMDKQIREYLS
ncbi:CDP-glucose 4,6-dehydratase [Desulfitobacterium dehalogenans ATCC 51507]|uniref:CDP-glucose 4,6-dehydratase n=1 Tax=Desulfitobacterium dehalogenans (strain ATCC 51507 / DSM 9161 / JW/IU-DC1) TaxID=756499 RepID=I4ACY7_DESDJ|nr:CDP-glucose 4,6-dehydratase [Desulfitobacterium dehalogenans ATCC 51507]